MEGSSKHCTEEQAGASTALSDSGILTSALAHKYVSLLKVQERLIAAIAAGMGGRSQNLVGRWPGTTEQP